MILNGVRLYLLKMHLVDVNNFEKHNNYHNIRIKILPMSFSVSINNLKIISIKINYDLHF